MQPVHRYIMLAGRLSVCFKKTLKGKQFGVFFFIIIITCSFSPFLLCIMLSCTWNVSLFSHRFRFVPIFIFYLIPSAWYLIIHYRSSHVRLTREVWKETLHERNRQRHPRHRLYYIIELFFFMGFLYFTTNHGWIFSELKNLIYHVIGGFDLTGWREGIMKGKYK